MDCTLIGVPLQIGAGQLGCEMGPSALRIAGLKTALEELGHKVVDVGNVAPARFLDLNHPNPVVHHLDETVAWTEALSEVAYRESENAMPIFLGGDHALSAGSVVGVAKRAAENNRPLFVLWLDAHTDYHTLETTRSGNLHGTPVAYYSGREGFDGYFPPVPHPVDPANICMIGIRSVDPAESAALGQTGVTIHDMRMIDEHGVGVLLRAFLERVAAAGGLLHVSLDVDFLDPSIAPAVGTTVPGGATFREAHLVMEMLCDSGLVSSLDLVELNPFLDERGRTARLMVDLTASLMGKRVLDRPTRAG
ncbi:arginase [Agrobacterium rubi TR3 = NBRC 13261]|uniref:Arginase n=1 Tax=Agrobacterium rubi TR3 = NBRC 13261 TaxID=1368415 RepID=A0A081CZD2_9HYPH|nr:arginase [Agrobacterium rubi]MBP1880346.1 arginase [Agrobacterium rubi]MCL6654649.1 arginase [Agrobacterium rubi]GAK72028.1 arginase [Agrobacterium rubi TR3 = NBRC 13261]